MHCAREAPLTERIQQAQQLERVKRVLYFHAADQRTRTLGQLPFVSRRTGRLTQVHRFSIIDGMRSAATWHRLLPLLAILLLTAPAWSGSGWTTAHAAEPASGDARLVDTYRKMLAEDPYQAYPLRRLLEVSHAAGGLEGLLSLYRERVASRPEDVPGRVVLGHLLAAADRHEEAVEAYEAAATLSPKVAGPRLSIARLHRRAQRWDEALAAFDTAVGLERSRDRRQEMLKEAAEAALEAKRADRALKWLDALVETEPGNLFLRMERAAMLGRHGQPEAALRGWEAVRDNAKGQLKHQVVVWRQMATLQEQLGRIDDAEATWREALDKTPRSHWARGSFLEGLTGIYRRRDALPALVAELEATPRPTHDLRLHIARLVEETGDDERALALFRAVVKARASDVPSRLRIVAILERLGRHAEVLDAYRALVKAAPGDPRHELELAELYFQRGDSRQGMKTLDRLSRRYPKDPGLHQSVIDLTMRYGDAADRSRIESAYKTLMRLEPREESHVISLGEYYWTSDATERGLSTWRRLKTMGRSRGEGRFMLAEVYADHGLTKEAAAEYQAAVEAEPDNMRFTKAYALFLEDQKLHAKALEQWERVLARDRASGSRVPTAATGEARRHIITIWERSRRLNQELLKLRRLFEQDPPDAEAGKLLSEAYLRSRRFDEAKAVLEKLREADRADTGALMGLERLYTRRNQLREAIAILEELARLNSRAAYEYFHRAADLALALGDDDLALEYTSKVVSLNPADPVAHARVGDLFMRLGRRAEAAEAWRQVLALDTRNYAIRFKLASLYRDLGKASREQQVLLDIVRESPDPGDVLRSGRRLIQLASSRDALALVEDTLRPLAVAGRRHADVYLKLLIEVFASEVASATWAEDDHGARQRRLGVIGERALRPALEALGGADVALRARALELIRTTRPHGAVAALSRLTSDTDTRARFAAAVALGGIGTTAAVGALRRMVERESAAAQHVAAWALGLATAEEATAVLANIASNAVTNPDLKVHAALALGARRSPAGLKVLHGLAVDGDARTRLAATWALANIAHPTSVSRLAAALHRQGPHGQRVAIWGLGRARTEAAQRALVEALWQPEGPPSELIAAALATSQLSDRGEDAAIGKAYRSIVDVSTTRLLPKLGLLLGVSQSRVSDEAERAAVLPTLRPLLERRVADILARGGRAEVDLLLGALLDRGDDGRLALRPIAESPAADRFTRELIHPHRHDLIDLAVGLRGHSLQPAALSVVSRLELTPAQRERALAAAVTAASRSDERAAAAALVAIARLAVGQPADDRAALATQLADAAAADDPGVRAGLAEALGGLAGPSSVEPLRALLRDPSARVRRAAVIAAGASGTVELDLALVDRLDDPVRDVAISALDALALLGTERARRALNRAATLPDPRLRARARAHVDALAPAPARRGSAGQP